MELERTMETNLKRFKARMSVRLQAGRETYGDDWKDKDLIKDMKEELLDLANYAFLMYHKIEERMKNEI